MKILVIFIILASYSFSQEKNINNPNYQWVEILNKNIRNRNNSFGIDKMFTTWGGLPYKYNICSIGSKYNRFKSYLKVIGELRDGEYIFEYIRERSGYGGECPSKSFFKAKLEDMIPTPPN